jgi:hypothetical protein
MSASDKKKFDRELMVKKHKLTMSLVPTVKKRNAGSGGALLHHFYTL